MPAKGQPRRWRAWSEAEKQILADRYPQSGRRGTQAALASAGYARSISEIAGACARYGIPAQRTYLKFPPDSLVDSAIIRAYQRRNKGDIGAVKAAAERLGRPYGWVKWRASQLGCVKPKNYYYWTPEEDEILAEQVANGLQKVQQVLARHGYRRSQTAILMRRERRHLCSEHPDIMTASGVARLLGLDMKTIGRWIHTGGLRARKLRLQTPTNSPGEPQNWAIHRKDLAAFLRNHPAKWDVRRVSDHYWIVELLAGAPAYDP